MHASGGVLIQPPGPRFFHQPRFHGIQHQPRGPHVFKFRPRLNASGLPEDAQGTTYDGKRIRKAIYRKTIDYNTAAANYVENRIWQRDPRDHRCIATDPLYAPLAMPPQSLPGTSMNCVTTKFIRTSTNKIKCPIFCVCWTPEGRRLITGASSGEFTLWNGLTFNFETILQAHDSSVRAMVWSHNDHWMLTADHGGFVKYWQSNMNNVKMYQAHKDPIRGLSFCPSDAKYTSCSDDGTVRVWDFLRCHEERICRGHGADVKCVDWHPQKALIASGSKDTQQPVKLWDPRTGNSLATLHAHKHTVMEVKWNMNGNWLLTASRDHLVKLFDIRNMKEEMQTFKGHKKEATTVAWHPIHESMFASGGSDGGIMFWLVGNDKELGSIDEAHEMMVWSLAWHPMGHILCSGSNDHTTKFWSRNRPGDKMRDRYNLNTLPQGTSEDMLEYDNDLTPNASVIPGMGLEYGLPEHMLKPEGTLVLLCNFYRPQTKLRKAKMDTSVLGGGIPGLDDDDSKSTAGDILKKKVPYAKPVPKMFEAAWESGVQPFEKDPSKPPMGQQRPPPAPGGIHPSPNRGPAPQMSGGPPGGHGPPQSVGPRGHTSQNMPPGHGVSGGIGGDGPRGPGPRMQGTQPVRPGPPPMGRGGPMVKPGSQMGPPQGHGPPGQHQPRYSPFPVGQGPRPPYQGGLNQSQYNQQGWKDPYSEGNEHRRSDSHGDYNHQNKWQGGSSQGYDRERNGRYSNEQYGKPGGNDYNYDDQYNRGYSDYNDREQDKWNNEHYGNGERGRKRPMSESSGGWSGPDSQGGPPKMRRPNDDISMRGRGGPRGGPGGRGGRGASPNMRGGPGGRGRGRGRGGGGRGR